MGFGESLAQHISRHEQGPGSIAERPGGLNFGGIIADPFPIDRGIVALT